MAEVTVGADFPLNMDKLDFGDFFDGKIQKHTKHLLRVKFDKGDVAVFKGDFKYDDKGHLSGGQLHKLNVLHDGDSVLKVTKLDVGADNFQAAAQNATIPAVEKYALRGDDTINGSDGNDLLRGFGNKDTINGNLGNDKLFGGTDNDTLNGNDGNDTLNGEAGKDHLNGGIGDDTLNGASGTDTLNGDDGNDKLSGGSGKDTMHGGIGNDQLDGDGSADTITGDDGNDVINGGSGDDTISGGNDGDNLFGSGGKDTINGDAGDDTIDGGSSEDTIIGGAGVDTMKGGSSPDVFRYLATSDTGNGVGNRDIISDFQTADKIDISAINPAGDADGKFTFESGGAYNLGDAGGGETAQVFITTEGTNTIVNIASSLVDTVQIELTGTHALTANNFDL